MGVTDAPYRGLADINARRSLRLRDTAAHAARQRSSASARMVWDDSRSTQFIEPWANLTNWSTNALVQVLNGRLYSATTSGGAANINHGINLGSTTVARFTGTISVPASLARVMIGWNNAAVGATPAANFGDFRGLYAAVGVGITQYDKGTNTTLAGTAAANVAGMWQWTMLADATSYSVTLVDPNGLEYRSTKWTRDGTFLLNNLMIYIADGNTSTGESFGPVGGTIGSISTVTPRAGIEGVGRTCLWTLSTATNQRPVKVSLPPSYDARVPSPWVMFFHGASSNEHQISDNTNVSGFFLKLVAAGFVVISANDKIYSANWGAQNGIDSYAEAYYYARDTVNLGPGGFLANSMGGIESLRTLAESRIPDVHAWAATSPTANLLTNYCNPTFTAGMDAAWALTAGTLTAAVTAGATSISTTVSYPAGTSILIDSNGATPETVTVAPAGPTGSGPYTIPLTGPLTAAHPSGAAVSDYPTKTVGLDPVLMGGDAFRGIAMRIMAATDDTTVPRATNTNLLKALVQPYATELVDVPGITGGHSFNPTAQMTTDTVAFFRRHLSV